MILKPGHSRALFSYTDDPELPWGWEEHRDGLNCLQRVIKSFSLGSIIPPKTADSQQDWQMTDSGITSNLDITNILLQYFHWPEAERSQIGNCHLNMEKALKRCKSVYGVDEAGNNTCSLVIDDGSIQDKHMLRNSSLTPDSGLAASKLSQFKYYVPFVTRKCPVGYKRYGCCKCVRSCRSAGIALTDDNDKPYESDEFDNALYCPKPRSYRSDHYSAVE